jgi:small subunit ribosomal protein S20
MFPALSRPIDGRSAPLKDQSMANTKSAKKAARQTNRRTDVNKARRTRLRSSVRKVEEAIASGDKNAAAAALKAAEPVIVRTGQTGVVHRKAASRKVSRLAKRVGAMGAP